jgi:hypothetical protein
MREGLASPGLDTRYWISRGTVATVDDSGEIDYTDPHAVWIGPEGVECDVILEPLGQKVTAVWGQGGEVADISPIHPGDQVVVECPDGDLMTPVIIAIVHSRSNKQPMTSGVPIFDNKRRLIYARKGDIDIRTAGGAQVLIEQAGTVTTVASKILQGDGSASEQGVLGTGYRQAEDTMLQDMTTAVAALVAACTGPLAPLAPGFADFGKALAAFQLSSAAANRFLSNTLYLKK